MKDRSARILPYQPTDFTVVSGDDTLERLREAFAKETTLYVGGFRLSPMVDDLTVGIKKGLHHVVNLPFPANLLRPYLCYIDSMTISLTVAEDNGHACLFNSAPDAIHLNRLRAIELFM